MSQEFVLLVTLLVQLGRHGSRRVNFLFYELGDDGMLLVPIM